MSFYNVLEVDRKLDGLVEGDRLPFSVNEERIFPKTPIFLEDVTGILGAVEVLTQETMNDNTFGSYRVLKVFNEQDGREFISLMRYPYESIVITCDRFSSPLYPCRLK